MGNTMAPTCVEQLGSVFTQTPVSARPPTYCRALGPLPFLFLSKKKMDVMIQTVNAGKNT